MSKKYNLFISHSWAYGDAYEKLVKMLDEAAYFSYKNHSVPKDDPIHNANSAAQLREAIRNQMNGCHAIIVLAGVYSTYSKWINEEIVLANEGFASGKKPIIAIQPWGAEKTSTFVKENADIVVGWNTKSIVDAIREVGLTPA
ncbi:TIR domain-containing protein [Enterovibrio norvegicus]|uniref:TIR domain-containing protein n=1 Tax=Enterovibrio norvegicus TaxID=188144 RepID=UPI0024B0685B|nr:TIR domain-containing protein [Enterovibrio norvegicus]